MYNFSMKIRNLTAKYSSHKGGRHTSAKDYNRQQLKQETKQMSEESKEPKFTVSQSWKELSEWEKANDVLIYGYLDAQEILEHFDIWKKKIDEKFASLSGTDKTTEEAKTENEHIVTVDLKQPIKPVGEI